MKTQHFQTVDYLRKTKPVIFSSLSTEDNEVVKFEDGRVENFPETAMDQKETSRLIKEILDSLSAEQRAVVDMLYYEQFSVGEIAEVLGVSENTVKSKEPVSVDAFDSSVFNKDNGVKLVYEGIAPNAELTIKNNCDHSMPQSYVEYSVDKTSNIANEDTLTFTAGLKNGAEEEGYILKETEGTITVEGLDSYVVDVAQLKAEDVKEIQSQMKELVNATYQEGGFIPTYINGSLNMYIKDQIGGMSDPAFEDKGFSAPESALTIFTFNTDLKSVGGFAEVPADYAGSIGCCTISGLIITADGELIREDGSAIEIVGVFTDEASMINQLKSTYQDPLTEGIFAK